MKFLIGIMVGLAVGWLAGSHLTAHLTLYTRPQPDPVVTKTIDGLAPYYP